MVLLVSCLFLCLVSVSSSTSGFGTATQLFAQTPSVAGFYVFHINGTYFLIVKTKKTHGKPAVDTSTLIVALYQSS